MNGQRPERDDRLRPKRRGVAAAVVVWGVAVLHVGCVGETNANAHAANRSEEPRRAVEPGGLDSVPADTGTVSGGGAQAEPMSSKGSPAGSAGVPPPELIVPVLGIRPEELKNNFGTRRGDRRHEGIDIVAPRGTPVVAAVDGWVWKIHWDPRGGQGVYLLDSSSSYILFYAHLDGYAEGLREGKPVRQGEVLGYVGSTGNVRGSPHLHLRIGRIRTPERWWEDEPLNPYTLLQQPVLH